MALTYELPDLSRMTLAYHTPAEWAVATALRLQALGCSPEMIERRRWMIANAQPIEWQPRGVEWS